MVVINEIEDEDTFSPQVLWAQRKDTISLKVNVAEAKSPTINMTETSFSLQVRGIGAQGLHLYKFQLEFYKPIDVEGCVYKVTATCIDVQLTKQGEGIWWPRLLPENIKKPHFLKLDFDRWKSESDLEDNNEQLDNDENMEMERLKEALRTNISNQDKSIFSKTFYLFLYNAFQMSMFFAIAMICSLGFLINGPGYRSAVYQSIGGWVIFAQLLSFLETFHALAGLVKTRWTTSLIQSTGRTIALLCLWLGGDAVQKIVYVWGVYLAWSTADVIRYPFYILQLIKRDVYVFTWLRYHAWILLYPLGVYCEYKIIVESAASLEKAGLYIYKIPGLPFEPSLSLLMRTYVLVLVVGLIVMMRHMWKMRSFKFGKRRKLKPT